MITLRLGRNDICHCGSEKKYKNCCLNKKVSSKETIDKISNDNNIPIKAGEIFINTMKFVEDNDWKGACHATASILYVLMKEIGLNPVLYIGEVKLGDKYFDHSWIEISGKIIDVAAMNTLIPGCNQNPIYFNCDIKTMKEPNLVYGVHSPTGLDFQTKQLINTEFIRFMDDAPFEDGLWQFVETIADNSDIDIVTDIVKFKYRGTKRNLK